MEKAVRVFHSFADADKADAEYYRSLTPQQRLDVLLDLVHSQTGDEAGQRLERVCRVVKLSEQ
jgi:hypothetical protein